jgi:hypothetical protein
MMSPKGLGWTIVDSLDTAMIMNLTSRVSDARNWVQQSLDYEQDQDVNTFETTIRMLGGLLSAHYLSTLLPGISSPGDDIYLVKAVDLADRLLGAYDSPSGIPCASVNLASRKGIGSYSDGGASSTAEVTSLQLEMKYLSNITGNNVYWRRVEKIMEVVDDAGVSDGLVPIFLAPDLGEFTSSEIRLGSRGDSYYGMLSSSLDDVSDANERRVPYRAVPANIGTGISRYVGRSSSRYPEASHRYYQACEAQHCCRTPKRHWWCSFT